MNIRRKWINTQVLLALITAVVFLAALIWTTPRSVESAGPTPVPETTLTSNPPDGPTRTPFPPEYYGNNQQTIGITFAGAALVLIVVTGVIVFMPKKAED